MNWIWNEKDQQFECEFGVVYVDSSTKGQTLTRWKAYYEDRLLGSFLSVETAKQAVENAAR